MHLPCYSGATLSTSSGFSGGSSGPSAVRVRLAYDSGRHLVDSATKRTPSRYHSSDGLAAGGSRPAKAPRLEQDSGAQPPPLELCTRDPALPMNVKWPLNVPKCLHPACTCRQAGKPCASNRAQLLALAGTPLRYNPSTEQFEKASSWYHYGTCMVFRRDVMKFGSEVSTPATAIRSNVGGSSSRSSMRGNVATSEQPPIEGCIYLAVAVA